MTKSMRCSSRPWNLSVAQKPPRFQSSNANWRIGYNRAARIIEGMEAEGIVSPPQSGGVRNVLIATSDE